MPPLISNQTGEADDESSSQGDLDDENCQKAQYEIHDLDNRKKVIRLTSQN